MGLGYDDMVRYADASLAAHQQRVTELAAQSTDGSWGDAAMRHRLRLESWRSAQRGGVHRWAIAKDDGAVCTCGLITGEDPLRSGNWGRFFGWLGHLDSSTDSVTARYVVAGGPFDHVLWCAFCGPIVPVRRHEHGSLDDADVEDVFERHLRLCPVPCSAPSERARRRRARRQIGSLNRQRWRHTLSTTRSASPARSRTPRPPSWRVSKPPRSTPKAVQ